MKIKSLKALKKWNENPGGKLPIVLEWWLDWMLISISKKEDVYEGYFEMIKFTQFCQKFNIGEALKQTNNNLLYWNDRASYDLNIEPLLKDFTYKIIQL